MFSKSAVSSHSKTGGFVSHLFSTLESKLSKLNFENQLPQPQKSNFQPSRSLGIFPPDLSYMPNTQPTQITYHKCCYFHHSLTNCTAREKPRSHGAENLFSQNDNKAAHVSNTQTGEDSPVKKTKHM